MKKRTLKRYILYINGEQYGIYYKENHLIYAIDTFYMCKEKWYETSHDYEEALLYRKTAKLEIKEEYLYED